MCRNAIHFPTSDDIPQQVFLIVKKFQSYWFTLFFFFFQKMQFAKTLTSQGHLCPLPGEICPVYWPYDHALYLYPLPDVVVVGDRFGGFTAENMECVIFNPVNFWGSFDILILGVAYSLLFQSQQGPFARNNFNFKVFIPSSRQVEDSEIGDS